MLTYFKNSGDKLVYYNLYQLFQLRQNKFVYFGLKWAEYFKT